MERSLAIGSSDRFGAAESANQWTHGIGFAMSLPAGWWLLQVAAEREHPWLNAGCLIYAVTLCLHYATSTLSHSFRRGSWRHRFRTFDQVCIFLLIAGNYTPFGLTYLRDGWGGALLVAMWCLAVLGIVLKLTRTRQHGVATWFYVLMGWIPVLALPRFYHCFGVDGLAWIFAGGLSYSAGIWFFMNDQRRLFYHAVWHLLVMLGSACHFVVILHYVVGRA